MTSSKPTSHGIPPAPLYVMVTMMSVLGLISSDIYLPALPDLARYFATDTSQITQTMSFFLLGLSLCQLFSGYWADRYGRRRTLLIGLAVYTLATMACIFATSVAVLQAARFFQALGACTGLVVGRAVISDLYDGKDAARFLTTIFPFVGASPAVAPVIGGLIAHHLGWRYCFGFLLLFALVLILLAQRFLKETKKARPAQTAPRGISSIFLDSWAVLGAPRFLVYSTFVIAAYGGYFGFLTDAPFILAKTGFTTTQIGFCFVGASASYIAGNLTAKRRLRQHSVDSTLAWGTLPFVAGGLALYLAGHLPEVHVFALLASVSVLTFGNGFLLPLGISGAIHSTQGRNGVASGLVGLLQLASAALASTLVGEFSRGSAPVMSTIVTAFTLAALVALAKLKATEIRSWLKPAPAPSLQ